MKGKEFIFGGEHGECAFIAPFIENFPRKRELPGFLSKIENTGDDRSYVLLASIVAERYLDSLLQQIAPGFDTLAERREFTFSLKIDLAKSLRLIPLHILNATDLIRRIRNAFAHAIDVNNLESCDQSLKDAMSNQIRLIFPNADSHLSSTKAMFKSLLFVSLAGLEAYRPNMKKLRQKLDDQAVIAVWANECHQEVQAKIEEIRKSEPISIVEKDGWRHSYYRDGLVSIEPIDPQNPPSTIALDVSDLNLAERAKSRSAK